MPSSASSPSHISSLSLHDALPISDRLVQHDQVPGVDDVLVMLQPVAVLDHADRVVAPQPHAAQHDILAAVGVNDVVYREQGLGAGRSEEHTSELQSHHDLVCRLLLLRPPISPLFPYTTLFRSLIAWCSMIRCQGSTMFS